MGEYGAFIWSAYGVCALVLGVLTVHIWLDMRRQRALLDDLEARGTPRRRMPAASTEAVRAGDGD